MMSMRGLAARLALCVVLLSQLTSVHAQEPPGTPTPTGEASPLAPRQLRGVTTLADLGFGDVRATGTRVVKEFFFPGPGDFPLGDNTTITVELSHSALLIPERSTMNVVLNDRPLRAIYLDKSNADGGKYVISVPRDVVRKDFNKIAFEFAMTLGLECEDPTQPSLYSSILRTTGMQLDLAGSPPQPVLEPPNLTTYPYPFFRTGYPVVAPVIIAIPNDPSDGELTNALRLAVDLASRVSFDLSLLDVRQAKDVTPQDLASNQLIIVGTPPRQPLLTAALARTSMRMEGETIARAAGELPQDSGFLALVESPWNPVFRALLITGNSDEAILRGVQAVTNTEPSALVAGPEAEITQPVATAGQAPQIASAFTLAQVGLSDRTIVGTATETVNAAFTAPALAAGASGKLDLILSTPTGALDHKRSHIIVQMNGRELETVEFSKPEERRAHYQVSLPGDLMRIGSNTLSLVTTLHTSDSGNYGVCASNAPDRAWVTIHSDSAISLPAVATDAAISQRTDLSSLPFPFAGLMGLQDTTFVVDPTRKASLRGGMLTAIALGRKAGQRSIFDVQASSRATDQSIPKERHIITVGLPPDSALAQSLERALPLVFRADGRRALVDNKSTLTEILDAARLGAIQTAQVPWAPSRKVLALSGTDDISLGWVTDAVTIRKFDGNVALLQSPTVVNTFKLKRLSDEELQKQVEARFTKRESLARQMEAYGLLGGGSLLMLAAWLLGPRLLRFLR